MTNNFNYPSIPLNKNANDGQHIFASRCNRYDSFLGGEEVTFNADTPVNLGNLEGARDASVLELLKLKEINNREIDWGNESFALTRTAYRSAQDAYVITKEALSLSAKQSIAYQTFSQVAYKLFRAALIKSTGSPFVKNEQ